MQQIRQPGAIQRFGALLAMDVGSCEILHCSENVRNFLELSSDEILGRNIFECLGIEPISFPDEAPTFISLGRYRVATHVSGRLRFFEFEKSPTSDPVHLAHETRRGMERMQGLESLKELLEETTRQIQRLTGFDRVMLYQFHPDDHGEVVAETILPGVDSYLGLHYPADDIPLPARTMLLKNSIRMIPDVDFERVAILPAINPLTSQGTGQAPDLSRTLLRAIVPCHLEYLKNMGVRATLTVSLLSGGKLWGLIACHHLTPKYLDENERGACETLGRHVSGLLRDIARVEEFRQRDRLAQVHRSIVGRLNSSKDIGEEISFRTPNLMDLIESEGSAAALYLENHWVTQGIVPNEAALNELVNWLSQEHTDEPVFSTDSLLGLFPPALKYQDIGAGLLAISVPKTHKHYILLFRPEIIRTVRWAGQPQAKEVSSDGKLHPRHSFAEWQESVRQKSSPWKSWEIDAALDLRSAILSLDLRRQFEKEQKARKEAELAVRSREELMAILSHDLKNPITSIQLQAALMGRNPSRMGDAQVKEFSQQIYRSTQNMTNLINDILHVTQLEAGNLTIEKKSGNLDEIVTEVFDLLAPIAAQKQIELRLLRSESKKPFLAQVDHDRIIQVLSNLIGNSLKFTPAGGLIEIAVEPGSDPGWARVSVADTGSGIPIENHVHVFDRFWQASHAKKLGTGLGLAICKGIIEGHGGTIWVESRPLGGTRFCFTVPLA